MALTKLGVPIGAEIVSFNHGGGVVNLELDSGDTGFMSVALLAGKPGVERQNRFDSLRAGMTLRVLPIRECGTRGVTTRFACTERLDHPVDMPEGEVDFESAEPKACAAPDPELVKQFPVGKRVKGKVTHTHGAIVIQFGGVPCRLPESELHGLKTTSVRKGVPLSAVVLRVDGSGVVLTRKGA